MNERTPRDRGISEWIRALFGPVPALHQHVARGRSPCTIDLADIAALIATWPDAPRNCAGQIMQKYGPPNEATRTKLFWYRNGPWKRTVVKCERMNGYPPTLEPLCLTQYIDYQVPGDMLAALACLERRCGVEQLTREVRARSDAESTNFLTLNLMHEIVTRRRSAEEARRLCNDAFAAHALGRTVPYCTDRLEFPVP